MKYTELIGMVLKNDILCDLFETYDTQVIYEYDRTHENIDDEYYAEIKDLGLHFVFDKNQKFTTLFIHQIEIDTFTPFEDDIKIFSSKQEALDYGKNISQTYTEGKADFFGETKDWIKFQHKNYSVHYEFVNHKLKMITLQNEKA